MRLDFPVLMSIFTKGVFSLIGLRDPHRTGVTIEEYDAIKNFMNRTPKEEMNKWPDRPRS